MRAFLILFLFIISPIRLFGEISLPAFIELHCDKFKLYNENWMLRPIILFNSNILTFPINQDNDTVFIQSLYFWGTEESVCARIWNNNRRVFVGKYVTIEKKHEYDDLHLQLILNWEPDVLKYLSKLYCDDRKNVVDGHSTAYLSRIIVENGNVKCNTVMYPWFDKYFNHYTQEQLDSVREKVRIINQGEYMKIVKKTTQKSLDVSSYATRSIWQRIADWFRSVWEWLFG
ncbi:hypothetical protein [Duncaniella sp.]|uniref:hypothetical protein n=1 Tax=Duncaniella sp. TaxID=2518496 RepID=UPI0023BDFB6D|nr:hypothetical protein [Duncaniella sp.]MDE5905412.1 hypothetical protein [Duncaniella sp.]